jgi:hypothetical protein
MFVDCKQLLKYRFHDYRQQALDLILIQISYVK